MTAKEKEGRGLNCRNTVLEWFRLSQGTHRNVTCTVLVIYYHLILCYYE